MNNTAMQNEEKGGRACSTMYYQQDMPTQPVLFLRKRQLKKLLGRSSGFPDLQRPSHPY